MGAMVTTSTRIRGPGQGGHTGRILRAAALPLKVSLWLPIAPVGEIGPFPPPLGPSLVITWARTWEAVKTISTSWTNCEN